MNLGRPEALRTARALAILLDRGAWHRAVGAEHAAVASERLKPRSAALAVVEELAGVGRHGLGSLVLALGTGQRRFKLHPSTMIRKQATVNFKLGHATMNRRRPKSRPRRG